MTQVELDTLVKSVKDATDALKAAQASDKENIRQTVEQVLKDVLATHPGLTPARKIAFAEGKQMDAASLLESMPAEVSKELDNCFIMSKILNVPVQHLKSWGKFGQRYGDFKKALDTAASGGGAEWIPTDFSSRLWELVRVQGKVAPLFQVIPMPSNPYTLPLEVGRLTSYKHAQQTGDTGQTLIPVSDGSSITGNITLTAADHAARVLVSKNLEEDSIIPVLPFLQNRIVMALAEGREDCIINGDTAGTMDSNDTASDGHNRLWNGLRRLALTNSYSADMATMTAAQLRLALRAPMGKFGVNPDELAYIVDLTTYIKMLNIDDVSTLEKFGPNATILKGQLAALDGIPVIVTEWARTNLNASGVYDGVTTSKSGILLVNRNGFVVGERRGAEVMILRELFAQSRQDAVIVSERVTFSPTHAIASNKTAYFGYNVG